MTAKVCLLLAFTCCSSLAVALIAFRTGVVFFFQMRWDKLETSAKRMWRTLGAPFARDRQARLARKSAQMKSAEQIAQFLGLCLPQFACGELFFFLFKYWIYVSYFCFLKTAKKTYDSGSSNLTYVSSFFYYFWMFTFCFEYEIIDNLTTFSKNIRITVTVLGPPKRSNK